VSVGRLRHGELLAAAGATGLVVSLFLSWFELQGQVGDREAYAQLDLPGSGFSQLGWVVVAACLLAAALTAVMVVTTATGMPHAIMATVLTVTASAVAFGLVLLRIVLDQPDLGFELPGSVVAVQFGGWLGLASSAALLVGAWLAMGDERTEAPESAYEPPPARPAPPAGA
jgi:hypothetical protein